MQNKPPSVKYLYCTTLTSDYHVGSFMEHKPVQMSGIHQYLVSAILDRVVPPDTLKRIMVTENSRPTECSGFSLLKCLFRIRFLDADTAF